MISLSFVYSLTAILQLNVMLSESLDTGLEARVEELENQSKAMLQQLSEYKEVNELLTEKLKVLNVLANIHRNVSSNYERKRQAPPEAVAFTAYISNNPSHLYHGQIIPYDRTVTNIGDAFNIYSHTFICPVSGLYMFSFTVCILGVSALEVRLVIDGTHIVGVSANPMIGGNQNEGSNIAVVQVRKGQAVHVMNHFFSDVRVRSDEEARFATFSGVLLHEM